MCGIAGFVGDFSGEADLARMASALHHRGPDEADTWIDKTHAIGLAHTRLAIIDLSPTGHQPMRSRDGRWTLVYNGEIYNHASLRRELSGLGHVFRGTSDTEVLLCAVSEWGVAGAAERCNGMFAFAVWDGSARTLSLARDRLGEKPLYYGWLGDRFLFASELKAIAAVARPDLRIDPAAVSLFFRFKYVPAPWSIYRGISKLLPGTVLTVEASSPRRRAEPKAFWSLADAAASGSRALAASTTESAVSALDDLLADAVAMRMVSDVPLGALLSGGVDSSLVVALMQRASDRPVRTFTIGSDVRAFDESADAAKVARHLGTDHTELVVTSAEAMAVIPRLPSIYDEPFADSSQIPTHLVSGLARRSVTVALSGDGGDEVFGGYNRHAQVPALWSRTRRLPRALRHAMAAGIRAPRPDSWARVAGVANVFLPARFRHRIPQDKVHKLERVLDAPDAAALYLSMVSHWQAKESPVLVDHAPPTLASSPDAWPDLRDVASLFMYLDAATYLPDDILAKVDRASMAVSLEVRAPYLDHRVVEHAWRLPTSLKVRDGGKWILRRVLDRYVPAELVTRSKMGFGVPIGDWLRGPLRAWAEELLSAGRLRSEGFLDPEPIRARWRDHLTGRRNWQYHLWDVLMFEAWLDEWSHARSRVPAAVGP